MLETSEVGAHSPDTSASFAPTSEVLRKNYPSPDNFATALDCREHAKIVRQSTPAIGTLRRADGYVESNPRSGFLHLRGVGFQPMPMAALHEPKILRRPFCPGPPSVVNRRLRKYKPATRVGFAKWGKAGDGGGHSSSIFRNNAFVSSIISAAPSPYSSNPRRAAWA